MMRTWTHVALVLSLVLFGFVVFATPVVAGAAADHANAGVEPGIEVLLHDRLDLIRGKHVGLITNQTGVGPDLTSDAVLLQHAPGVHLVALYGPEHGIEGAHQAGKPIVGATRDPETGLPVYSLYGAHREPTPAMLKGVDVLVYDIQPVGARFYTYLYTMADAMKAAAKAHIPFIVLDRPNPIDAVTVQGPVLQPKYASFVGEYPIPLRYGMTVGELAELFNDQFGIHANLTVVKMRGYRRSMFYGQTSLPFVIPSPNMPTVDTALVYPGMGLVEGTNVSEGRGTTRPFQMIGAPWIDAVALARAMNAAHLQGVRFRPAYFTPTFSKYQGQLCGGVEMYVFDRNAFNPVIDALTLIKTIHDKYPGQFKFDAGDFDRLVGNSWVREGIEKGLPVSAMEKRWQRRLDTFKSERAKYLLY
ncbi:MAG: exo-beta-N-acetylmuramidase NamZ family protein [Rhodanobacteraceae bacterium]